MTESIRRVGQQVPASGLRNLGRFSFCRISAQIALATSYCNVGLPFTALLTPADASELRGTASQGEILHVLRFSRAAQIGSPTIKLVQIDVVDLDTITENQAEQFPMQIYDVRTAPIMVTATRISGGQAPDPLIGPIGVVSVDQYIRSDAAIFGAERNTNSILRLHSDLPPSVAPRAVSAAPGYFACRNFTKEDRLLALEAPRA